jgi:hypothetical protein
MWIRMLGPKNTILAIRDKSNTLIACIAISYRTVILCSMYVFLAGKEKKSERGRRRRKKERGRRK